MVILNEMIKCAAANIGEEGTWCNEMMRVLLWEMNNVPHLFFKPGILEFVGPRLTSSPKCWDSPKPALVSIHSSKAANMQNSSTLDISPDATFHFEHAFLSRDVVTSVVSITVCIYSAVHGIWPVEELAKLAGGPTGCGELTRDVCSFARYFSVTR